MKHETIYWTCDRCGQRIEQDKPHYQFVVCDLAENVNDGYYPIPFQDLCVDCGERLGAFHEFWKKTPKKGVFTVEDLARVLGQKIVGKPD